MPQLWKPEPVAYLDTPRRTPAAVESMPFSVLVSLAIFAGAALSFAIAWAL